MNDVNVKRITFETAINYEERYGDLYVILESGVELKPNGEDDKLIELINNRMEVPFGRVLDLMYDFSRDDYFHFWFNTKIWRVL